MTVAHGMSHTTHGKSIGQHNGRGLWIVRGGELTKSGVGEGRVGLGSDLSSNGACQDSIFLFPADVLSALLGLMPAK